MSYSISEVQQVTSPNPFCLVTSCDRTGKTNIMALSWWTYVSNNPPTVSICVGQKAYTCQLIKETQEFGLCLVDESLSTAALACGACSGRDVDKSERYGIELIQADKIAPPIVKAHRAALECAVIQSIPVHDHLMFIAEVQQIHINPNTKHLYAFEGYSRLGIVSN